MLAFTGKTASALRNWIERSDQRLRKKLAGQKMPSRHKLARERHRQLVNDAVTIMRRWEMSPFEYEASCRNGLRAGLCLRGWRWADADHAAAEIVDAALRRIGAVRPTWQQGQPEWTQDGFSPVDRTFCAFSECDRRIPQERLETRGGYDVKYCSRECAGAAKRERDRWSGEKGTWSEFLAASAAKSARWREDHERACEAEGCDNKFLPSRAAISRGKGGKFCSPACYRKSRQNMKLVERPCASCMQPFMPSRGRPDARFCSRKCIAEGQRKGSTSTGFRCDEA